MRCSECGKTLMRNEEWGIKISNDRTVICRLCWGKSWKKRLKEEIEREYKRVVAP